MAETFKDMVPIPAETGSVTPEPIVERLSPVQGELEAQRAALEQKMVEDQARAEKKALEVSAGLKRKWDKSKPVITLDKPRSQGDEMLSGLAKLGATWPVGPGAEKGMKQVGYGLSGIFTAIENAGHDALKKSEKYWKWIPFVGAWLGAKPEKSWKEKDEEEAKKKEAEAKKKKKEGDKIQKLKDKGLSEDIAKALLEGTAADEKEEKEVKAA